MDTNAMGSGRLKYDAEDVEWQYGIVTADLNKYVARKYPELRDAEVVKKSTKSRSMLDLCWLFLKQKHSNKPWFVCLLGKCFTECEAIKINAHSTFNANNHLCAKHSVIASKTKAHNRSVAMLNKHIMAPMNNSGPIQLIGFRWTFQPLLVKILWHIKPSKALSWLLTSCLLEMLRVYKT